MIAAYHCLEGNRIESGLKLVSNVCNQERKKEKQKKLVDGFYVSNRLNFKTSKDRCSLIIQSVEYIFIIIIIIVNCVNLEI